MGTATRSYLIHHTMVVLPGEPFFSSYFVALVYDYQSCDVDSLLRSL